MKFIIYCNLALFFFAQNMKKEMMKYFKFFILFFYFLNVNSSPVAVPQGGTGLSALTAHALIIGNATSAASLATVTAATGVPLVSQGSSANPSFSTAAVAGGGTGLSSLTAYALLAGGTTSTSALQQISGVGNTSQVLTSAGAAALPTWSDPTFFQTAVFNLTAAQVNALVATPLVVVAAPGSNKVVQIISCTCKMTYGGTTAFATSAGNFTLVYNANGGAVVLSTVMANASIIATTSRLAFNAVPNNTTAVAYSSAENVQVVFTNSTATDFTAGTGNTVQVTVTYKILTI